jgi:hypothetical protein
MTPQIIAESFPPGRWELQSLWEMERAAEPVDLSEFVWMFALPVWQLDGRRFVVRPADVIASPDDYPDHYARIMDASLEYPIHTIRHQGRLTVLDGFHRVAKAAVCDVETIQAIMLTDAEYKSICPPE